MQSINLEQLANYDEESQNKFFDYIKTNEKLIFFEIGKIYKIMSNNQIQEAFTILLTFLDHLQILFLLVLNKFPLFFELLQEKQQQLNEDEKMIQRKFFNQCWNFFQYISQSPEEYFEIKEIQQFVTFCQKNQLMQNSSLDALDIAKYTNFSKIFQEQSYQLFEWKKNLQQLFLEKNEKEIQFDQIQELFSTLNFLKQELDSNNITQYSKIENKSLESLKTEIKQYQQSIIEWFPQYKQQLKDENMLNASVIQPNTLNQSIFSPVIQQKKLKDYTQFQRNQVIAVDENLQIEFKDFRDPLTESHLHNLNKVICGFLNQKGGRIYIGIQDQQHKVVGVYLSLKQRDEIKLNIDELTKKYQPPINNQDDAHKELLLKVYLRLLQHLYRSQGNPKELYFGRDEYSYNRRDGSVQQLTPTLFKDQIIERQKIELPENWESERNKKFNDPQPDEFIPGGEPEIYIPRGKQEIQSQRIYVAKSNQLKQMLDQIQEEKKESQSLQQIITQNVQENAPEESKHQENNNQENLQKSIQVLSLQASQQYNKQEPSNIKDESEQSINESQDNILKELNIDNEEEKFQELFIFKIQFSTRNEDFITDSLKQIEDDLDAMKIQYKNFSKENQTATFEFQNQFQQDTAQELFRVYQKNFKFKIIE